MSTSTIAIISRFTNIDVPYLSQWFEYYDKLGISHYYMINTYIDTINLETILEYYPKGNILIYHSPRINDDRMDTVLLRISFFIAQDYTLHVDADEFLYLGNNISLQQFLSNKQEYNYFRFNWLMAPSSNNNVNQSLSDILNDNNDPKYFVTQFKSMAKTNVIKFPLTNPHEFSTILGAITNIFSDYNNLFIIHFSYRNEYDAFLKSMCERKLQKIDSFIDELVDEITVDKVPDRIIFYVAECSYTNHTANNVVPLNMLRNINMNIKSKTNFDFLFSLITNVIKYNTFRDKCEKIKRSNLFDSLTLIHAIKVEISKYISRLDNNLINI
jgi:hypothetical protein